ncbi:MAG: DUF481 domain-containing protein [Pseudobdellovibrio sp.]
MKVIISVLIAFCTNMAYAQDTTKFTGESEASVVLIDGLSKSETWGAKTKNVYTFENNDNVSIFGKYLKTSTQAAAAATKTETALNWEVGARYEKSFINDVLNGFIQHKAESDPYNGIFTQRDSTDLGAKYFFIKTDDVTVFTEAGIRFSTQNPDYVDSDGETSKSTTAGRLYVEAQNKFNESTSGKLWVEYIPNFKSNDFSYTTAEASLSVAMSSVLSLKTAYQVYYREMGPKQTTTTWTTALVAKY